MSPWDVLRLPSGATRDSIKKAYRKMVRAYHPDKADPFMLHHNEEVIKIINAAYDKLMALDKENP
jgi:molecular chaperone DnaJ